MNKSQDNMREKSVQSTGNNFSSIVTPSQLTSLKAANVGYLRAAKPTTRHNVQLT